MQIHFSGDILVALASFDLKVPVYERSVVKGSMGDDEKEEKRGDPFHFPIVSFAPDAILIVSCNVP